MFSVYNLFNFVKKTLNMKNSLLLLLFVTATCFGQVNPGKKIQKSPVEKYIKSIDNLTLEAAYELTKRANETATSLDKKVTITILDVSGNILMTTRGENVGPHNTEASRRKAFTALSTKTATLALLRNAKSNPDTQNLNTLPELLLLSGGAPVWYNGNVIGSIGIAGGGSAENDDLIAKSASISEIGITIK